MNKIIGTCPDCKIEFTYKVTRRIPLIYIGRFVCSTCGEDIIKNKNIIFGEPENIQHQINEQVK